MMVLNESSRRFLTLVLFFLLGPSLLVFVGYKLYSRNTQSYLISVERRLPQLVGGNLHISGREFLRPGAQRLLNVTLTSKLNEEMAFCPEIYLIEENDLEFIKRFASSIDVCSTHPQNDSFGKSVVDSDSIAPHEDNVISNNSRQSLASLVSVNLSKGTSAQKTRKKGYTLIVIPTLYCQENQILKIKAAFMNLIQDTIALQEKNTPIRALAVGKLYILKPNKDNRLLEQVASTKAPRKSNRELAAYFNVPTPSSTFSSHKLSNGEIEDKVRLFESDNSVVNNIRALYIAADKGARIDAIFNLDKISLVGTTPHFISIETNNKQSTVRIELDFKDVPTPVSFMATFVPFFQKFGRACWFSGKMIVNSFSSEQGFIVAKSDQVGKGVASEKEPKEQPDVPRWSVQLENACFQNCILETLNERAALPLITGQLSNLTISEGLIRQGIFEGTGTVKIKEGSIPVEILDNLCKTSCLEVVPSEILNFQFLNNSVPFTELELHFKMNRSGIVFDSKAPEKIVAYYVVNDRAQYFFFLPEKTAGRVLPYSKPLYAFVDPAEEDVFRTPIFKNALKHLPVTLPTTTATAPSVQDKVMR